MFLWNLNGFCATQLCFLDIVFNKINIYLNYFHNNKRKGKARKGKARQGKGREGKGRQGKGREGKGRGRKGKERIRKSFKGIL